MAIKIEILGEDALAVQAAFYYAIPPGQVLPAAEDQSRAPAGNALPPNEIQDLKDGKIFELIWESGSQGLDTAARRSKLVNEWAQEQGNALATYKDLYKATGDYYDGTWHEV